MFVKLIPLMLDLIAMTVIVFGPGAAGFDKMGILLLETP